MEVYGEDILVSGSSNKLFRVNTEGKIVGLLDLALKESSITSTQVLDTGSILIGTNKPDLLLVDSTSCAIKSTHQIPPGFTITHISTDDHRNWFCATALSKQNQSTGRLYIGSTRSLSAVYETESQFISNTNFIELSSNGLSLIGTGPTPQITLFPLDLSTAIPRMQLDPFSELSAVFATAKSQKGDLIALGGVGQSVLLVSAFSLNIVRHFQ